MKDNRFETRGHQEGPSIRIIIAMLVVVTVGAATISVVTPKRPLNLESQVHIDFTPSDSYCADMPRLAAAYAKERESNVKGGADVFRDRAILAEALRELTRLSEACAGEMQALRADKFRVEHENQWLTECLVSDHCDCCSEGDGVVLVGCPETEK